MNDSNTQLSNPFSTGGGGASFESQVQASFAVLLLAGGYAPGLPCWPVHRIMLQAKYAGYNTDDMVVFTKHPASGEERKLLGQIKHAISITENDKTFGEVIQAAWLDFMNASHFKRNKDALGLITGPLSATDIQDARTILEWARHEDSADSFFNKIALSNFSSQSKRNKLQAFRVHLKKANGGQPVPDEVLFSFLRHFHLLGYDLDLKAGVTLSLLQSLLNPYGQEHSSFLWARLVNEIQSYNKNAGPITLDSLSQDLKDAFAQRRMETIPTNFEKPDIPPTAFDWSGLYNFALITLLGSWEDGNMADQEIITSFVKEDYESWAPRLRYTFSKFDSPLSLENGRWNIDDRKAAWKVLGPYVQDGHIEAFQEAAILILSERDQGLEVPPAEKLSFALSGKTFRYSGSLRKGVTETLALLGNFSSVLPKPLATNGKAIAQRTVQRVLGKAEWQIWASLNRLLPIIAEASPKTFLAIADREIPGDKSPLSELFSQDLHGILGESRVNGFLWALETLAWEEENLIQVCGILGDLAHMAQRGNGPNAPLESLTTILMPWLPQTTATVKKRMVAVQMLSEEVPAISWKLLISLISTKHQVSDGSRLPTWRASVPLNENRHVTKTEYQEIIIQFAEMAIGLASNDGTMLQELVVLLDKLPNRALTSLLDVLSSEEFIRQPEDLRLPVWQSLTDLSGRHRRHSNAPWALPQVVVRKINEVCEKLAPSDPLNLHRRLFIAKTHELYEETGNWESQELHLKNRREQAIKEILQSGGVQAVLQFAQIVEAPWPVGYALGSVGPTEMDARLLPEHLETENQALKQLVKGYIWARQEKHGYEWVDTLNRAGWRVAQKAELLARLPFQKETWTRADEWLVDDIDIYWKATDVNAYREQENREEAIERLITHNRPKAALDFLYANLHQEKKLDASQCVKALLAAAQSPEEFHSYLRFEIEELIKALQQDPSVNPGDILNIEWTYLSWFDSGSDLVPVFLERRLASEPSFFCETIALLYRSSRNGEVILEEPSEEERAIASKAWSLLHEWTTPPGLGVDGAFLGDNYLKWLEEVKNRSDSSGHLEIALSYAGKVSIHCPPDPGGLWIHRSVAKVLNGREMKTMRSGFTSQLFNSRGSHVVDPFGGPERELAKDYRQKAEDVEDAGFGRLAVSLRELADTYDWQADRYIEEID